MPTQAEIDAEYENAELKRRLERVEAWMNALDEAGLDRLRESGLVQFDGIGVRLDVQGIQVTNSGTFAGIWFVLNMLAGGIPELTATVPASFVYGNATATATYLESGSKLAINDSGATSAIVRTDAGSTFRSVELTTDSVVVAQAYRDASTLYTNFDVRKAFEISGVVSPSQITSNQDNYEPTGLETATVLRLSTDASRDITGIAGGADGRVLLIFNVGSNNIVLKDDVTSTAANRFALNGDITLQPDNSVILWYDSTSSRWRAV